MVEFTFIFPNGDQQRVQAQIGMSIMEVALSNGIELIRADCGGACACATCHVYIEGQWQSLLPPMHQMEEMMLDFAMDVTELSRLSCQIRVTEHMQNMQVRLPEEQI